MKKEKSGLHANNKHKFGYDFESLCLCYPKLKPFVFKNDYGNLTIDFGDANAVKLLNTALLQSHYNIEYWEFPDSNLTPPIPGRVEYIHKLSDVLKASGITESIKVLDIGTGASCIYPILGQVEYDWSFVGTDIDASSIEIAQKNIDNNQLIDKIKLRFQKDKSQIFDGVVKSNEKFSASMCNPPFYKSGQDARNATERKLKGLGKNEAKSSRNFSGTQDELWYPGGEKAFVHNYLYQSSLIKSQCFWFSTLVSQKENVKSILLSLKKLGATDVKIIAMNNGNKVTRFVAWTFLTKKEQQQWINS